MSDAKRFLRYIVPGSVYFIEVALLVTGIVPGWTIRKVAWAFNTETFDAGTALGVAIGYLVTSGALGFLFNTIHHTLYWIFAKHYPAADYRKFVDSVGNAEPSILNVASPLAVGTKEYMNAWVIATKLWHELVGRNETIKSAHPRAELFADIVHGLGSCRVALWSGFLTAILIVLDHKHVHGSLDRGPHVILGWFLTLVSVGVPLCGELAYRQTLRLSDHFVIRILQTALSSGSSQNSLQDSGC